MPIRHILQRARKEEIERNKSQALNNYMSTSNCISSVARSKFNGEIIVRWKRAHRTWTPFDEIINEIDMVCDVMLCAVTRCAMQWWWCVHRRRYCNIFISHFNKTKNSCAPFRYSKIIRFCTSILLSKPTWLNCTWSNLTFCDLMHIAHTFAVHAAMQPPVHTHSFYPGIIFLSMQINRLCAFLCISSYKTLESMCKTYLHPIEIRQKKSVHVLYCSNVITVGLVPARRKKKKK